MLQEQIKYLEQLQLQLSCWKPSDDAINVDDKKIFEEICYISSQIKNFDEN